MTVYPEDEAAFEKWLNEPIDWDISGKPITNLSAMKWYRPIPDETTGIINFACIHAAFLAGRNSMRPPVERDEKAEFAKFLEAVKGLRKNNDDNAG